MVENIGSRLKDLCDAQGIELYLSEAQCEEYPYAVYDADYTPFYDKDGMRKIIADVVVKAYSKESSDAETLASAIDSIILDSFASGAYTVRATAQLKKECLQEIWSVSYQYRITQFRTL